MYVVPGTTRENAYLQYVSGIARENVFRTSEVVFQIRIQIRIHRIHMFLGLPDPDPSILKQKL